MLGALGKRSLNPTQFRGSLVLPTGGQPMCPQSSENISLKVGLPDPSSPSDIFFKSFTKIDYA